MANFYCPRISEPPSDIFIVACSQGHQFWKSCSAIVHGCFERVSIKKQYFSVLPHDGRCSPGTDLRKKESFKNWKNRGPMTGLCNKTEMSVTLYNPPVLAVKTFPGVVGNSITTVLLDLFWILLLLFPLIENWEEQWLKRIACLLISFLLVKRDHSIYAR